MDAKEIKEEIGRLNELLRAQNTLHDRITRSLRQEIYNLTFQLQENCQHNEIVAVSPIGFSCWSWEPVKTCLDCGKEFQS